MIKDLVVKSRSYRGYDESRKVSREELLELVDCARFAPSSVNGQPFRYLLVYEKEKVDRLLQAEPHREDYFLTAYGDSRGDRELLALADEGVNVKASR